MGKQGGGGGGGGGNVKFLGKPLPKKVTASLKLKNEEEISKWGHIEGKCILGTGLSAGNC